jgi:predicted CoA-binding protein
METKRTLLFGASENPDRYSYRATQALQRAGHAVAAFGKRKGTIGSVNILSDLPDNEAFDTVTLYLNPENQKPYYDYILKLKPNRVIFNPGTENSEFEQKLDIAGIGWEESCTLVLLSIGAY